MANHIESKCEEALLCNGFSVSGERLERTEFKAESSRHLAEEEITKAALELEIKEYKLLDYELPESAVNISVDDVCVKRQTETRPRPEKDTQAKRVNNTVIHVQHKDGKYILNSATIFGCLKLLLGFLLCGDLLNRQLVFFTDGAKDIHNEITRLFAFANHKIILDWWHLNKKLKEELSRAMNGRAVRNAAVDIVSSLLWFGNVDGAISALREIDVRNIKDQEKIEGFIKYLERVREYIPCYAMRKKLGLRNSSNLGEKANDLVVSGRQKHNGMSWSNDGSHAFASVASIACNQQLLNWIHGNDIQFQFCIQDFCGEHDVAA